MGHQFVKTWQPAQGPPLPCPDSPEEFLSQQVHPFSMVVMLQSQVPQVGTLESNLRSHQQNSVMLQCFLSYK